MIYEIKNLEFSYRAQRRVLDSVCLTVKKGDILTILGRNGAGKSTLLGCMLGLLKPQGGEVRLMGRSVAEMSGREIAMSVGYVPQSHAPSYGYTVMDFVLMGCASQIGLFSKPGRAEREAAAEALRALEIEHLADRSYIEISGGERQAATVARAIVSKPEAVLFDEPTAHLDYGNQLRVLRVIQSIAERGFAVVMTTHNPEHALLLGGRAALLDDGGRLEAGATADVVNRENLSRLYGTDVRLEYIESLGRTACLYPNL